MLVRMVISSSWLVKRESKKIKRQKCRRRLDTSLDKTIRLQLNLQLKIIITEPAAAYGRRICGAGEPHC